MDRINDGLNAREMYELIGLQPEIIEKLEVIGDQVDLIQAEKYLDGMMNIDTAQQSYQIGRASCRERV